MVNTNPQPQPRAQEPKSRGCIVCLKTYDEDGDNQQINLTAREIAEIMGIRPARVYCSDIFNGFAVRGEISEECVQRLREADILVDIEKDFEAHAVPESSWHHIFSPPEETRPWWTERIGLYACETAGISADQEEEEQKGGATEKRYAGEDVDVFILDTGVEKSHPYLNVVETRSFLDDEPETDDLAGHGTQCAGIIGARDRGWKKDEHIDVVGIAPNVCVHGFKVLGKDGSGGFSDIVSAVEEVAKYKRENPNKRVLVNMSLGGYVGTPFYTVLDREIARLVEKRSVPVVVAAGNDGQDCSHHSPAHTREAITVGCFDQQDVFSRFSNYGKDVDILAPGNDIRTSTINGGVDTVSGTSFACPMVCGAATLLLAKESTKVLSPQQVQGQLISLCEKGIKKVPAGTANLVLQIQEV